RRADDRSDVEPGVVDARRETDVAPFIAKLRDGRGTRRAQNATRETRDYEDRHEDRERAGEGQSEGRRRGGDDGDERHAVVVNGPKEDHTGRGNEDRRAALDRTQKTDGGERDPDGGREHREEGV